MARKKGAVARQPTDLIRGLEQFSDLLTLSADFNQRMSQLAESPELKKFQSLTSDPTALAREVRGLPAENLVPLFAIFARLGQLGPQLAKMATLTPKERRETIEELRNLSRDATSLKTRIANG